jgi:hypothetical protein
MGGVTTYYSGVSEAFSNQNTSLTIYRTCEEASAKTTNSFGGDFSNIDRSNDRRLADTESCNESRIVSVQTHHRLQTVLTCPHTPAPAYHH